MFNFLKRNYIFETMVQFDEDKRPCICGCSVKWLDKVSIKDFTERKACRKALKFINEKYPQYNGLVQIW